MQQPDKNVATAIASASRTSEPQDGIASASHGRTDGRTTDENDDCTIPELSDARARVRAIDVDVVSLADALKPGVKVHGYRHPVLRTGSRDEISQLLRHAVYHRDGHRCVKCGGDWEKAPLELDHITPWSAGGTDEATNLRTLCKTCNQERGNWDDAADGERFLPVTWWCVDCHDRPNWWEIGRPAWVYMLPFEGDRALTFAYCATCDTNSYAEETL